MPRKRPSARSRASFLASRRSVLTLSLAATATEAGLTTMLVIPAVVRMRCNTKPETTGVSSRPDVRGQQGQLLSSPSVAGRDRSQYTSPCGHRCQCRSVRRYTRGVALPWDVPFKKLLLRVLERIFD